MFEDAQGQVLELQWMDGQGHSHTSIGKGNGPIAVTVAALNLPIRINSYEERSLGSGDALETADRTQPEEMQAKRLHSKIQKMRQRLQNLQMIKAGLETVPDRQISRTNPDARAMTTYSAKGTAMVGYNVQTAVDTKNHLIFAHEVASNGSDRAQLSQIALTARNAMGKRKLKADR